jgi:hypothetical protein
MMEEPSATLESWDRCLPSPANAVQLLYNNVGSLFNQLRQIHSALDPKHQRKQSAPFSHLIRLVALSWGGVKKVTAIVKTGALFPGRTRKPVSWPVMMRLNEMWLHFYASFEFLTNLKALRLLIIAQQNSERCASQQDLQLKLLGTNQRCSPPQQSPGWLNGDRC